MQEQSQALAQREAARSNMEASLNFRSQHNHSNGRNLPTQVSGAHEVVRSQNVSVSKRERFELAKPGHEAVQIKKAGSPNKRRQLTVQA